MAAMKTMIMQIADMERPPVLSVRFTHPRR
jgi:hypothetical protein